MKTIEYLVVEKYLNQRSLPSYKQIPDNNYIDWANIGAREAQRWISIKDELPDNQDIVLVKTDKAAVSTAYLHGGDSGFVVYGESAYNEFGEITHWRPIERQ